MPTTKTPASRRPTGPLAAATALLVATMAVPATAEPDGDPEGSVEATVTVAEGPEACLLISTPSIDFEEAQLGDFRVPSDEYTVESCTEEDQELFIAGSDAESQDSDATWDLVGEDVQDETDRFGLRLLIGTSTDFELDDAIDDQRRELGFATEATPVGIAEGADAEVGGGNLLYMPIEGSSGVGETMAFDVTWTAAIVD